MKLPFQSELVSQSELEIRAIFDHNQTVLTTEVEKAGQGAAVYSCEVEGKRCFGKPMNLYVEHTNGKILAVTSIEKEKREKAYARGNFAISSAFPNVIYPVTDNNNDQPIFGDIAKIAVWYQFAYPILDKTKQTLKGKILIDRPESWSGNNQIILSDEFMEAPINVLLSDPLDRGVFLKSLENFNATEEPNYVDAN
jgi:hypothetical protein